MYSIDHSYMLIFRNRNKCTTLLTNKKKNWWKKVSWDGYVATLIRALFVKTLIKRKRKRKESK
jgi:hypothetical protein